MASRGMLLNNSVDSVNSIPWVHYEIIQRGSLVAIRYAARTVRIKLFFRASTKIF